jgi:hypothetical protein
LKDYLNFCFWVISKEKPRRTQREKIAGDFLTSDSAGQAVQEIKQLANHGKELIQFVEEN